MVATK